MNDGQTVSQLDRLADRDRQTDRRVAEVQYAVVMLANGGERQNR